MTIHVWVQNISYLTVLAWLDMFVEISNSRKFRMICTIMSVIVIVINVKCLLWVLKHSETFICKWPNTNMNCTCSVSSLKNVNGWLKIMSFIKNVPKNVSPRISISCHLDWSFGGKPYFLSDCDFVWHACQRTNKASPCKVYVRIPFFVWRMVNNSQWIFTDRILIVPIQSSHVNSLPIFSCLTPDTCDSASSFYKLRENI